MRRGRLLLLISTLALVGGAVAVTTVAFGQPIAPVAPASSLRALDRTTPAAAGICFGQGGSGIRCGKVGSSRGSANGDRLRGRALRFERCMSSHGVQVGRPVVLRTRTGVAVGFPSYNVAAPGFAAAYAACKPIIAQTG